MDNKSFTIASARLILLLLLLGCCIRLLAVEEKENEKRIERKKLIFTASGCQLASLNPLSIRLFVIQCSFDFSPDHRSCKSRINERRELN